MKRYGQYEYKADKGKMFVLVAKGKELCASYRHKTIGESVREDINYAYLSDVENGYVEEVPDPHWVVQPGFRAVYNNGKYVFDTCNPVVYPTREMAECAAKAFNSRPWNKEHPAYVIDALFEGHLEPCREYEGKTVYNEYYWSYDLPVGSLVEEKIADDLANCLPPKRYSNHLIQGGDPHSDRIDETTGKYRTTYATFVKVAEGIWEWRGYCFVGETEEHGHDIPYVV